MEEKKEILVMEHISKQYPGVRAVDDVSFTLLNGEIHALVGANGAGKSTLVGILSGARSKDEGKIFINGREVEIDDPLKAIDLGIGYVPQELILVGTLSVAENIFLNRQPRKSAAIPVIDKAKMIQDAKKVLDRLGIEIDVRKELGSFPASTQQMVALAMAISRDAKIMILDEPTSSLSKKEIQSLFEVMTKLRNEGHSIIYISHRLEEVFEIADRLTVLRDGKSIGTYFVDEVNREILVNLITGKQLSTEINTRILDEDLEVKMRVNNLNVDGKLHDICFEIKRGEVLGLFGQVGSGRTELLRTIFGLEDIESGEIYVDSKAYVAKSPSEAIENQIGFLTEDRKNQGLVLNLSIADNFLTGFWNLVSKWFVIDEKQKTAISSDKMEAMQIKASGIKQETGSLSGGNQQKVVLGKWLIRNSQIMLLDEPTKGIDVGAKAEFYRIIKELAAQGITVLLVSSELPEIMTLCDRVLVMKDGVITGEFIIATSNEKAILEKAL